MAGAVLATWLVSVFEAVRAAGEWRLSFAALLFGDQAVLVPLACIIGLGVGAAGLMLDPGREWSWVKLYWRVRSLAGAPRARWAAVALVTPAGMLAWMVATAHAARLVLSRELLHPSEPRSDRGPCPLGG